MNKQWKLGEVTDKVWAGDLVSKYEYITNINSKNMLFYDKTFRCFRSVFREKYNGESILNGWNCASTISKLLKTLNS